MRVASFSEIEDEFIERVFRVVWCSAATIDTHNRPRSRVLHPIWEGKTGWIATNRHSLKEKHLARNAAMSLAYVTEPLKPVYVECIAEWADDIETKQRIWDLFKNAAAPMGYDPAIIWSSPEDPKLGILKLTPWRIEVATVPGGTQVWQQDS